MLFADQRAKPSEPMGPGCLHKPNASKCGRKTLLALIAVAAGVLALVAVAGAAMAPRSGITDFELKNLAPCLAHPFGTDWMGRDMFARTIAGLSASIRIGLISAVASSLIAFALAACAAFGGQRADLLVGWLVDLVMGVPHIVLLILISYALGKGEAGVMVGVALTHWTSLARVLRAEMLQVESQPYMDCSRALGVSKVRLVFDHVVPNVLPQYLVGLVLLFPHAILHEASITFLGFGIPPEKASIGMILSESMAYLSSGDWWLAVFPGAALLLCVLLFDRIGAGAMRVISREGVQS